MPRVNMILSENTAKILRQMKAVDNISYEDVLDILLVEFKNCVKSDDYNDWRVIIDNVKRNVKEVT